MPDIKYLTIQLPTKITWEQENGSKVKLKLKDNNDKYKTITNYELNIYTNENPNTNVFCNVTLEFLKEHGSIYIEDTKTILEILNDSFYTNYINSMEILYISKEDILTSIEVIKLIHDNSYIKILQKEKELDYQAAIDNQININITNLIGELEKQFLQLGIRTIINDKTYSEIAKLILDTNKIDILEILAKNTSSIPIYCELKPQFGKYHDNAIHADDYTELEVAKIMLDFGLPVTKNNVHETKQDLDIVIQRLLENPNISIKDTKLYLVAKVSPEMIIHEIKSMKDLKSHKNVVFDQPNLYIGSMYSRSSKLSEHYIEKASSCDFISQKDPYFISPTSWVISPLLTTKISFQETKQ